MDATGEKILLGLILNKNIYTGTYINSKKNYDKLIILINKFLLKNKTNLDKIKRIYVNRGPGSFAGIRNSLSVTKAIHLAQKIDYYSFSFEDFKDQSKIKYENIPNLCNKFNVKKNLIKPIYIS